MTDGKQLRSDLSNLIANSIKYYNPVQQSPFVKVSYTVPYDDAIPEVQDNWKRIQPQYTEEGFAVVFRGTNRSSGSGPGLYIVKAMIGKLDGEITLIALAEKTSTFGIILPNRNSERRRPPALSLETPVYPLCLWKEYNVL